jgi:UDP-N-acetylglucosamine--N-acetylmuramyl-(pentapeptide) pyrophosphoryl-undecaprenol N-acetylglucosamine transferase
MVAAGVTRRARAPASLRCVAAGLEVSCFVGREVASMLDDEGEVGRIDTCGPGKRLPQRFANRVREDISRLRHVRPEVVVSDGDGPSIHAALALGIPSVAVGHGVLYATCHIDAPLPASLARSAKPSTRRARRGARPEGWWCTSRPLGPSSQGRPWGALTYRRPLCHPAGDDGSVLAYFRDDDGYEWLDHLAARGERVVLFGTPSRVPTGVTVHRPDADVLRRAPPPLSVPSSRRRATTSPPSARCWASRCWPRSLGTTPSTA